MDRTVDTLARSRLTGLEWSLRALGRSSNLSRDETVENRRCAFEIEDGVDRSNQVKLRASVTFKLAMSNVADYLPMAKPVCN